MRRFLSVCLRAIRSVAVALGIAVAMVLLFATAAFASDQERWTGQDKAMHFSISAAVGFAAINQWPDEPGKAFALAMVPGLLKELSDAQRGGTGFSGKDMVANALGAALGVATGRWLIARQGGQTVLLFRREF